MKDAIMNEDDRLATLRESLSNALAHGGHSSGGVLDEVVRILPGLMDADRCSIFIRENTHDRIWLQSGTGMIERELDLPIAGSISGEVIVSGRSVIINDLTNMIGTHTDVEIMTGYTTRNMLCVPIFNSDKRKVRGVLQVINKNNGAFFNEKDGRLAEDVADLLKPLVGRLYNNKNFSVTQSWQVGKPKLVINVYSLKNNLLLLLAAILSGLLVILILPE